MIKAALLSSFLLLAATVPSFAQTPGTDTAIGEGVRRQHNILLLRQKLTQANSALGQATWPTPPNFTMNAGC